MQGIIAGLLGCVFGVIGVFAFGLVFVPLAVVCSLVGLIRGVIGRSAAGVGVSLIAGALGVFGFITSPSLWLLTAGMIASGAILSMPSTPSPVQPQPVESSYALQPPTFTPLPSQTISAPNDGLFVGCASDGQGGPMPAPTTTDVIPWVPAAERQELAYYRSGALGVLAPKGWNCVGLYGSGGLTLIVTPEPHVGRDLFAGTKLTGPAVVLSRIFGSTSGRFVVAEVAARLFPSAKPFVERIMAENLAPQNTFQFQPYPADVLTRQGATRVEFMTPADSDGIGTAGWLARNDLRVTGVAFLLPHDNMDLVTLDVRLPVERRDLAPIIVGAVENDSRFFIPSSPPTIPAANLPPSGVTAQQGTPAALEQANAEWNRALMECHNRRMAGEVRTFVASVQCSNPRLLAAYQQAGYPYMDLIRSIAAKRLALAEAEDQGRISEAEFNAETAEFISKQIDRERERNRP